MLAAIVSQNSFVLVLLIDERQITLIRARLKYDLYDFFGVVLGLLPALFLYKRPKNTPWKSHIDHILGGHRLDE